MVETTQKTTYKGEKISKMEVISVEDRTGDVIVRMQTLENEEVRHIGGRTLSNSRQRVSFRNVSRKGFF